MVVAGLSTLYIANRHADDLVVDEYYRDGLAINRQLAKQERAQALGISSRLEISGRSVTAHVSGPVEAQALRLDLSHPLEADRDFSVPLTRVGPGTYRGELQEPVFPRWHWRLEPMQTGAWRLDGSLSPGDLDHATGR